MRNQYEIRGQDTVIFIKHKGEILETLIETADLEKVSSYDVTWYGLWDNKAKSCYVVGKLKVAKKKYVQLRLHRLIMDTPKGMVTDHIHHDTLDNRRRNLRNVTYSKNTHNTKDPKHIGARFSKRLDSWVVDMRLNGKRIFEKFGSEKEAYDRANELRISYLGGEDKCL